MGVTLRGLNATRTADYLNALGTQDLPTASPGAGVANTVVQTSRIFPFNYKIRVVAVMFTAIDAVAGGDSFNLVVGGIPGATGQTYTQGNVAANDNSDTWGSPTNIAVAGNCVFGNDVPINVANLASANTLAWLPSGSVPSANLIGQSVPNTGWLACATTGGYGLFVPTNWDAVYPAGIPLSVRTTTVATTGTITALSITLGIVPIMRREEAMSVAGQTFPVGLTDF
jgi:hypothetical protein